jgi:hypothetical protein
MNQYHFKEEIIMRKLNGGKLPEKGQKISAMLYRGPSKIEAEVIFDFLKKNYNEKILVPLKGSTLRIDIMDVNYTDESDPGDTEPLHMVTIKGVLV